jgi:hypothetical protein
MVSLDRGEGYSRSSDWGLGGGVAGDDIPGDHDGRADHDCAEEPTLLPIMSGRRSPQGCELSLDVECQIHSIDFRDVGGTILPDIFGSARFAALQAHSRTGAVVLDSWARREGQGALGPVEMLAFLTARHRRASPPNVSEQPRMSLGPGATTTNSLLCRSLGRR